MLRTLATLTLVLLAPMSLMPIRAEGLEVARDVESCAMELAKSPRSTSRALPLPLRVATWNTEKFSEPESAVMLESIAKDADLLFLQESLLEGAPQSRHGGRIFAPGYSTEAFVSGVAIRYREPPDVGCTLSFAEPWLQTPKMVAAGRFPLADGSNLLAVTVHGINFTFGTYDYRQQLAAIRQLLDAHAGPALVIGDFNHWNPWRADALRELAQQAGLLEAQLVPDLRSRHFGMPVDGIFLRGLTSIDATAIPTESSDHNPLTATLQLMPNQAP